MVVGGELEHGDYTSSTLVVDLTSRETVMAGRMGRERFSLGLCRTGDRLVAVGGFDNSLSTLVSVEEWDEEGRGWVVGKDELETGRAEFGVVSVPSEAVCGLEI